MTFNALVEGFTSFINTYIQVKPSELHIAICRSNEAEAVRLIRSGTNFRLIEKGCSNISLAIKNLPNMEVIRKLVGQADLAVIDYIDQSTSNALMSAACEGHRNIVQLLLEKRANPNICDLHRNPPLSHAIIYKSWVSDTKNTPDENGERILKIAKMLCQHGATVDPVNSDGYTPLQSQVNQDVETIYPRVISYLVEEGANVTRAVRTEKTTPEISEKIQKAVQEGLIKREAKPTLRQLLRIEDIVRSIFDYV